MGTGPTALMATPAKMAMARTETAQTVTEPTAATATELTAPTRRPSFPHLGQLVGAADVDAFLREDFGRQAFRRHIGTDGASRLFGWSALNRALAEHRLGPPRLKLEKGGKDVGRAVFRERRPRPNAVVHDLDVPGLYEHLRGGATLILDAVNELHAPLQDLCSGLGVEFRAHSQANLYACWGTSQGFDVHWDDHDVFVVQVEGTKRWDLYGVTRPAPMRRDPEPASKPTDAPSQLVLEAGDMLYLPRGYWHAAVGLGSPSLHLTIGLSRKTGVDFLHWLVDQSVSDPATRVDVGLEQDDAALGTQVAAILARLNGVADPTELGRRYRRYVEASARHRPQLSLPDIGAARDVMHPATRLRLTQGATGLTSNADGTVRLRHRGTEYTLAAETAPAIEALATGEVITYADMQRRCQPVTEQRLRAFVQDMVSGGVFMVEPGE
ncbi:MAG: cupin domain-containing protein [Phenylobacterium sp.]|nr:cupin domain-containing protein [Phenylobacterium sp.]